MNITISTDNASLKYVQSNILILEQYRKRNYRTIIIWAAVAVALVSYDVLTFNDWSWKSGVESNIQYYNFHLGLGVGIACIYMAIFLYKQQIAEKDKFVLDLYATAKRHFSISNKEILTLTDETIKFDSEEIKYEYKWSVITSYLQKENFIFLLRDSSFSSSLVIDKRHILESELNDLMVFLNKNKPETKEFHKPI